MAKVFSLERFANQEMVLPAEVTLLLLTMSGGHLRDALSGIFAVFAESDGYMEASAFADIFDTLAFLDEGTQISEAMRQEVRSSFVELPPVTLDAVLSHPAFANL